MINYNDSTVIWFYLSYALLDSWQSSNLASKILKRTMHSKKKGVNCCFCWLSSKIFFSSYTNSFFFPLLFFLTIFLGLPFPLFTYGYY